jgi:FSR family fosmidomycin resistance protein-like MFS transporter
VRPRLIIAITSHAVVDFLSFIIVPLMTVLIGRVSMTPTQGAIILAVGSVASGVIQPLVAWLSDHFDTRWLGTLAFFVAVVSIGLVGFVHTFPQLLLLQVVACAGFGAYHPVAAAAVGQLSGAKRSSGLVWFYTAGMAGGMLGNLFAPLWARHFGGGDAAAGLPSFIWLIPPGLACVALLGLAIHSVPHRHADAHAHHSSLPREERIRRWRSVWLLYFGNVLRFLTDMCLIQLIVRWAEERAARAGGIVVDRLTLQQALTPIVRTQASQLSGELQAARQAGIAIGGVVLLTLLRGRSERALLTFVPVFGAIIIAITPFTDHTLALVACVLAGLGYGGVIPTTLSMAQRLLPHRTSLASGLMLGGAWCLASIGPVLVQWLYAAHGLFGAFAITAVILAASGVVGAMLPREPVHGR